MDGSTSSSAAGSFASTPETALGCGLSGQMKILTVAAMAFCSAAIRCAWRAIGST
jgi:hypothetical protein